MSGSGVPMFGKNVTKVAILPIKVKKTIDFALFEVVLGSIIPYIVVPPVATVSVQI
jgi:hypothetical protein